MHREHGELHSLTAFPFYPTGKFLLFANLKRQSIYGIYAIHRVLQCQHASRRRIWFSFGPSRLIAGFRDYRPSHYGRRETPISSYSLLLSFSRPQLRECFLYQLEFSQLTSSITQTYYLHFTNQLAYLSDPGKALLFVKHNYV